MSAEIADEHERSLAFAKIALGQIRALHEPATPRNYKIWYTYATGHRPQLNQHINDLLQKNGTLTDAELEEIHINFFSAAKITERLDQVGAQVRDEIEQVRAMIENAAGSATNYSESLAGVTERLSATGDNDGLRTIVESLVHATKEMERSNQALEERLTASKQEITQLQQNLEAVRTESLTDPLTTLANRKLFDQTLDRAMTAAAAKGEPLSLLMTDIDHFKNFNDTYGHQTGDQVLRLVAASLKNNVKGQDLAARYGGEEFAVILPNTVLRSAVTLAEHIRRAVMAKQLMKRSTN